MSEERNHASYSSDVQRIEDIIDMLKKGCDIDEMLSLVKEATDLITRCQAVLARTGIQIDEALQRLERTNDGEV